MPNHYVTPRHTRHRSFSLSGSYAGFTGNASWSDAVAEGISQHNDSSVTKKVIVLKHAKGPAESPGGYTYYDEYSEKFTSVAGTQMVKLLKPVFTLGQMYGPQPSVVKNTDAATGAIGLINKNSSTDWVVDPYQMNPNQKITGSAVINNGTGTGDFNPDNYPSANPLPSLVQHDWIFIHNLELMYMFTGGENIAQNVEFVFNKCKTNTNGTPLDAWQDSLKGTWYNMKQNNAGVPANAATFAGGVDYTTYGTEPFYEKEYLKYYDVLFRKAFVLQPGDTKILKLKVEVNKYVDRRYLASCSGATGQNYLRGLTLMPFIIVRPMPIVTSDNGTQVTTGPADVLHTCHMKVDFKYSSASKRLKIEMANNSLSVVNSGTAQLINDTDTLAGMQQV